MANAYCAALTPCRRRSSSSVTLSPSSASTALVCSPGRNWEGFHCLARGELPDYGYRTADEPFYFGQSYQSDERRQRAVDQARVRGRKATVNRIELFCAVRTKVLHEYVGPVDQATQHRRTGRLLAQLCDVLQVAHDAGIVHRDVKPGNLMLDHTLTVKVLDFGLARQTGPVAEGGGLTLPDTVLGTPEYMAPEQAKDAHAADIRADVYGLGCVLYHALAGQPPFPDTNIISQMIRHATETARPLKEFNPAVPDGLQQIVNWMLAKDPAARRVRMRWAACRSEGWVSFVSRLSRTNLTPIRTSARRVPVPR